MICNNRVEEGDRLEELFYPSDDTSFLDKPTLLTCPAREYESARGILAVLYDPISFAYRDCICPLLHYWNVGNKTCRMCPTDDDAFICDHTKVHDSATAIIIKTGFYPFCVNNDTYCAVNQLVEPTPLRCSTPSACNPGQSSMFTCADGYDITSLMCSRCLPDYYSVNGRCVTCPSNPTGVIAGLTITAVVILLIGVTVYTFESGASALPAMVMFWFQLSDILDTDIAQRLRVVSSSSGAVTSLGGLDFIPSLDMSLLRCVGQQSNSSWSAFEQVLYLKMIMFGVLHILVIIATIWQRCTDRRVPHIKPRRAFVSSPLLASNRSLNEDDVAADGMVGDFMMSSVSFFSSGQRCATFPARFLMVCYFLIETLYLPLCTQLMQVRQSLQPMHHYQPLCVLLQ